MMKKMLDQSKLYPVEIIECRCCGGDLEIVKCTGCGETFPKKGSYFAIAGNIYVGDGGGLVGNNFNDDGTLGNVSIFCLSCLKDLIDGFVSKVEY